MSSTIDNKKVPKYYTLHDAFNMELKCNNGNRYYMKSVWMPLKYDYDIFPFIDGVELKNVLIYISVIRRLLSDPGGPTIDV